MATDIFGVGDIMWIRVGKNKNAIAEYIRKQIHEDQQCEQLTMKEYIDQFTGESGKENK